MRPLMVSVVAAVAALAATGDSIEKIDYIGGFPGQEQKLRGRIVVSSEGLVFESRDGVRMELQRVVYVAAGEGVRRRSLEQTIGEETTVLLSLIGVDFALDVALDAAFGRNSPLAALGIPLLAAPPLAMMLREKDLRMFSVEYAEGPGEARKLVLFRARKDSANAVKRVVDEALGLTIEHYREIERKEELLRREMEQRLETSGTWEAEDNVVAGGSKANRTFIEEGVYDVLLGYGYIGLRPWGAAWAKYRLEVSKVRDSEDGSRTAEPIYAGDRLVGFDIAGMRRLFY